MLLILLNGPEQLFQSIMARKNDLPNPMDITDTMDFPMVTMVILTSTMLPTQLKLLKLLMVLILLPGPEQMFQSIMARKNDLLNPMDITETTDIPMVTMVILTSTMLPTQLSKLLMVLLEFIQVVLLHPFPEVLKVWENKSSFLSNCSSKIIKKKQ